MMKSGFEKISLKNAGRKAWYYFDKKDSGVQDHLQLSVGT